ncbi:hypothetical protein EV200_10253 [Pedobacter psychrotolerans]|uniref:Uncharacterized protein n=1 Tax=Pedobacter psychrotolerans TaxID=1843235 RepID=A0A4R2HIS4_9SPHI|nr:hypothetical protein [Pedobacter psychrotolerans]TCO28636.1 hypothetical protein EV200_10253 [Pedobacter psychrotolerans]GGE50593.1 hypothetical protein GCM10011413_16100 [Pedobacter psychrotolerans]
MKRNLKLTTLIAVIIISLLYSCKKETNDQVKPTLQEVSLSPEGYGYSRISKNELTNIKGEDLSKIFKNFSVYYNKQIASMQVTT